MQRVKRFEDLLVFKRAYELSLEVHKQTQLFPRSEQYDLASQLRRASKSICANLAEGFAKQSNSKKEFRRYILIAIGSTDEVRLWIRYSYDLGYIDKAQWKRWREAYQEIAKMLTGLHKRWC